MENIAFVLWLVLWPLSCAIEKYYVQKRMLMVGEDALSDRVWNTVAFFCFVMWIIISVILYKG